MTRFTTQVTTRQLTRSNEHSRVKARGAFALVAACAIASAALGPRVAFAQVHEGDIILDTSTGTINTGRLSAGAFEPLRLFLATLGQNSPNIASDPGFDCVPGSFPVGTRNGVVLIGPLQEWDAGSSSFIGCDSEYLRVEYLTLFTNGPLPSAAGSDEIAAFTISVQSNGQWHRHMRWILREPQATGVYAQRMRLVSTSSTLESSLPFYLVMNQGEVDSVIVQTATDWLEINGGIGGGGSGCATCPADFNQDGGVTGDDIAMFFAEFEAGTGCADVNQDGGITGDDVSSFFIAFESGGC